METDNSLSRRNFLGAVGGLFLGGCVNVPNNDFVEDFSNIEYEFKEGDEDKETIVFNHGLGGNYKSSARFSDFWNKQGYSTLSWTYLRCIFPTSDKTYRV